MNGKHFSKFLYILILLLLVQYVTAIDLGLIYNRKPIIIVPFEEESLIVEAVLERNGDKFPVTYSTKDNKTYKFRSEDVLYNGAYTLTIKATDILENTGDPIIITFEIDDLLIELKKPTHGVSSADPFDIAVTTGAKAECRYGSKYFSIFDNGMVFEESNNRTHELFGFKLPLETYTFYVLCRDLFGYKNNAAFPLSVDTTPPIIKLVELEPDEIVEAPIQSLLEVKTDDESVCKFSFTNNNYEDMEFEFSGYDREDDNAYKTINTILVTSWHGITNEETYNIKIRCENKAELISERSDINLLVNLTAGLRITSYVPRYAKEIKHLNISTNQDSSCYYSDDSGVLGDFFDVSDGYIHAATLPTLDDGTYEYYITCVPVKVESQKKTIIFTIDSTPPALEYIKFLPKSVVFEDDGDYYTWDTREIEAEWEFEDNETDVVEYNYSFIDHDKDFIVEWTLTDDNEVEIEEDSEGERLNLTDEETYILQVKAKNIAGVWSEIYDEDIEIDLDLKPKDETSPTVTLVKETLAAGVKVTLVCKDTGEAATGCNLNTLRYLASITGICSPVEIYTEPFIVTETSIVCWSVSDRAGNSAEGQEQVVVGEAVCDTDFDGDGYGLGCEPDCDDTNASIYENCPSECIQDIDGDGRGIGCDLGPDCDDTNPLIHKNCYTGCTQDTDGDGYGLGCEPDCDDNNPEIHINCPSECIQDTDGDGYGMGCEPDCDDFDPNIHKDCPNGCVNDNDGDGYGKACDLGEDCDDTDPEIHENCVSGCYVDNDGDKYGLGCPYGLDCDDLNPPVHLDCPSECTQDTDGDGYGWKCTLGPDCDDTNPLIHEECYSGCTQDTDGDGYGLGCDLGPDCDDTNPLIHINCASGCTQDTDGDDYGMGCTLGPDCDDTNPDIYDPSIHDKCNGCENDLDGDGYGWGCEAGRDCDDTNSLIYENCPSGCVQDTDGDSYGPGCTLGPDCDDFDPSVHDDCTEDCTYDSECDGMDDDWETENGLDPDIDDSNQDPDCDGATNIEEYRAGTDPQEPPEGMFVDCDNDGAEDKCEREYGFDPNNPLDGLEDTDGDGLTLAEECSEGTNPLEPDTDGDGWSDGKEIEKGTDPLDPTEHPTSRWWLWILIIVLVILAGVGGYYGYLWYQKKQAPKKPAVPLKPTPKAIAPGVKPPLTLEQRRFTVLKGVARRRKEIERKKRERIFEGFAAKKTVKKPLVKPTVKPKVAKPVVKPAKPKQPMEKLGEMVKGKSSFGKLENLTEKKKLEGKLAKGEISKIEFNELTKLEKDEFSKLSSLVKKKGIEKLKPSVKKSYFEKLAGLGKKGESAFKGLETTKKDEDIFKKLRTNLGKKEDVFEKLPVKKPTKTSKK